MDNIKLPKHFFEDNPLEELSAARMAYVQMTTAMIEEFDEKVNGFILSQLGKERREQYAEERENIRHLDKAEDIVSYMRKLKEMANRNFLIQKAMEYQDEVAALVLKKIRTSGHSSFIETASMFLANVDEKYVEQLYEIFPDIRNPYARSMLCIVFGIKKKKEYASLLLDQFEKIKKQIPDENYEQGPLLALYLIYDRY